MTDLSKVKVTFDMTWGAITQNAGHGDRRGQPHVSLTASS